jgi:uncharacterized protein (TIGR03067 family)
LVAVGLLLGADEPKKNSGTEELKKIQGQWTVESLEANGEKLPADEAKKMKLTIKDENWTLDRGDDTTKGTIKLAPSKNPKEFDAMIEGSGDAVLGLYELKGDTLKMCWTSPGGERPTAFKGDDGKTLVFYKKAKSD